MYSKWEVLFKAKHGNVEVVIDTSPDYETPNSVYGIWEQAGEHEGGTTVKDPESGQYYTSCNTTPAELAKEFAKQGRSNPSRAAYESLQEELLHYLYGEMVTVRARVFIAGVELAWDSICTDTSEQYPIDYKQVVREYFDLGALRKEARSEACTLAQSLCA